MTDERNGPEETFHDTERKLRERIKALERERSLWRNECWVMREAWVEQKAALAAMTAERDEWQASWQEVLTAGYAMKARLAKAVKALREIERLVPKHPAGEIARATLAEIGEADHE